jgi:hypothetical protein
MTAEELKNYAKATDPWQQAWNAANAMSISATRIAVKQMELAALTTQFMNQRLSAYSSFDGRVEPLMRRLDELTEQYAGHYAAQVRAVFSSWADAVRADQASTEAVSLSPDREASSRDERAGTAKAKARRTNGAKRAKQRRHTAAH